MLYILVGDYKSCIAYAKTIDNNLHYTNNIVQELQYNSGLLSTKTIKTIYFLYKQFFLKDKKNVDSFLKQTMKSKDNIICIADTIDKKSSFYKRCKQYIKEFKTIDNIINVNDVIKDPMLLYKLDNVVSMFYKLYYNYKFKNDNNKMKLAAKCINNIITGTMLAENAIQYYILKIA